jgi:hypothetical protein
VRPAKKLLRKYLSSNAPCESSACRRKHFGWTFLSAKPVLSRRRRLPEEAASRIVAYNPAD